MSELVWCRSTSELLPRKCFTVALTPWLWTPSMYATAIRDARNGSSPKYSKLRPHIGAR